MSTLKEIVEPKQPASSTTLINNRGIQARFMIFPPLARSYCPHSHGSGSPQELTPTPNNIRQEVHTSGRPMPYRNNGGVDWTREVNVKTGGSVHFCFVRDPAGDTFIVYFSGAELASGTGDGSGVITDKRSRCIALPVDRGEWAT